MVPCSPSLSWYFGAIKLPEFQSVDTRLKRGIVKFWRPCHLSFQVQPQRAKLRFPNSKSALVEHLPPSTNPTALDHRAKKKSQDGGVGCKPPLKKGGVAGPSAALDLPSVLCPAGISVSAMEFC